MAAVAASGVMMGIRSVCAWALFALLLTGGGAGTARAAFEVPGEEMVFTWTAASGPVAGYFVYVSINDGPLSLDHATDGTTSLPIAAVPGDRVRISVRAFDEADNVGPASALSEVVVLLGDDPEPPPPPPPPPGEEPEEEPPANDPPQGTPGREISVGLDLGVEEPELFRSAKSKVKVRLEDVASMGAKATAKFKLDHKRAQLALKAKGLEPHTEYELRLDGVTQGFVTTNGKGKAKVKLKSIWSGEARLSFDPRGGVLSLHDDQGEILSALFSGPGEPRAVKVKEQTRHQTDAGGGHLWSAFRSRGGHKDLRLHVSGVPQGSYRILLDGAEVGSLDVGANGAGSARFGGGGQPLDFDPRGAWFELEMGGQVYFGGEVEAQLPGFSICDPDAVSFPLQPLGAGPGRVDAHLEVDEDCNLRLRLQLADVSGGVYELRVGGEKVATVQTPGGDAMVELESAPTHEAALRLPVDPRGAAIELEQGGAVQFAD